MPVAVRGGTGCYAAHLYLIRFSLSAATDLRRRTTRSLEPRRWCQAFDRSANSAQAHSGPWRPAVAHSRRPGVEALRARTVPAVSILNNSGNGYAAPELQPERRVRPARHLRAAGPSAYVETVNQAVALYNSKATGGRRRHRQPEPLPLHDRRADPGRLQLGPV